MSSRALRRLEKKRVEESQVNTPISGDEEEPEQRNKFNAFALLDGESSASEHSEDEAVPEAPKVTLPSKKSKKRKNKKKQEPKEKPLDSDEELDLLLKQTREKDHAKLGIKNRDDSDAFDFEEEFNVTNTPIAEYDSNFKYFTTARFQQSVPLLRIDIKDLDPDREFRNLFGKLSLEAIEDADSTSSSFTSPEVMAQIKKMKKMVRGWGGKDRRSIPGSTRKLIMTKIRDDWIPSVKKSVSMEELSEDDILRNLEYKENELSYEELEMKVSKERKVGIKYFKFFKNNTIEDRLLNSRFYASVVITPDHESLISLLQQSPYHIETILQVATILVRQGDKSNSNGLVERGLFVFDRGFKSNFELGSGLVRLPFENYLNRQFYLTLFRYITILSEKSTFMTALTYCKLLLSINPTEDPYGVRYFIDFYAIMAGEYDYLVKFAKSPLCTTYDRWLTPGICYSTVLAYIFLKDFDQAKEWLVKSYKKFPYCGLRLLESIGKAYQSPSTKPLTNQEIELSTESYLIRADKMWDEPSRNFLHDEMIKIINEVKIPKTDIEPLIPLNLLRFSILSGESKIMAKIPKQVWDNNDIYDFDVLPPHADDYDVNIGGKQDKIVDKLNDYIDDNVITSIIQNRTQDDDLLEMIRRISMQGPEE